MLRNPISYILANNGGVSIIQIMIWRFSGHLLLTIPRSLNFTHYTQRCGLTSCNYATMIQTSFLMHSLPGPSLHSVWYFFFEISFEKVPEVPDFWELWSFSKLDLNFSHSMFACPHHPRIFIRGRGSPGIKVLIFYPTLHWAVHYYLSERVRTAEHML